MNSGLAVSVTLMNAASQVNDLPLESFFFKRLRSIFGQRKSRDGAFNVSGTAAFLTTIALRSGHNTSQLSGISEANILTTANATSAEILLRTSSIRCIYEIMRLLYTT
jgi:hypothetical protein